jgi:hypothetical protein
VVFWFKSACKQTRIDEIGVEVSGIKPEVARIGSQRPDRPTPKLPKKQPKLDGVMTMTAITVKVLYKNVDGAHFFVANDEGSTGLCVAHSDIAVAYDAVSAQLTKLYKQNHDIEASFQPEMSPSAFIKWGPI